MGAVVFGEARSHVTRRGGLIRAVFWMVTLALVVGLVPSFAFADYGPEDEALKPAVGSQVVHSKTGVEVAYTVLKNSGSGVQGTAMLGKVDGPAIAESATGTVLIPKNVCIVYAWEESCVYEVTKIAANAFSYGEAKPAFTTVLIEGDVALEEGALNNLPDTVSFKTYSKVTADALVKAGLSTDRVSYEPLGTRYVVFGDSISAGYALTKEYNASSSGTCDNLPTPPRSVHRSRGCNA